MTTNTLSSRTASGQAAAPKGKSSKNRRGRVLSFDVLNIFSCFCIIWLHCNSVLYSYDRTDLWDLSLFVQVAAHFAVPCFFMLSGANLINYRERHTTKQFLQRRVMRTLIPLLIWSGVTLAWKHITGVIVVEDFRHIVFLFLTSTIENVYWFFFPLFGIYLAIPVLSLFADKKYLHWMLYLALLGIGVNSVFPYVLGRIGMGYSEYIVFPLAVNYLPYALLGYYLANARIPRPVTYVIYAVGLCCALYMFFGTDAISAAEGGLWKDLIDYESFASYGYGAAVFLLFKNLPFGRIRNAKVRRAITGISGCSLGVYLIHMLTMDNLVALTGIRTYSFSWQLFGHIPVYFIALAIVLAVKKIPRVGKVLFP